MWFQIYDNSFLKLYRGKSYPTRNRFIQAARKYAKKNLLLTLQDTTVDLKNTDLVYNPRTRHIDVVSLMRVWKPELRDACADLLDAKVIKFTGSTKGGVLSFEDLTPRKRSRSRTRSRSRSRSGKNKAHPIVLD